MFNQDEVHELKNEITRAIWNSRLGDFKEFIRTSVEEELDKRFPLNTVPVDKPFEEGFKSSREGRLWCDEEERTLRNELVMAIGMIAAMHRRTSQAIRCRLKKMGIVSDYSLLL
jgi:hypothetical protein